MKIIKFFILTLIILFFLFTNINAASSSWLRWGQQEILDNMIPDSAQTIIPIIWQEPINDIAKYIRDFIFWVLWIIAVWVFLYFWFKLITAQWNEEEFKKSLIGFVYAIIWIAIVPLSWAVVKLILWLKVN